MAYTFELALECGSKREDALRLGKHFDGFEIHIPETTGSFLSICRFACWQDSELNWWCSVLPSNVSQGDANNKITTGEQLMIVAQNLYQRLKSAPSFRYAVVGNEVTPFDTFSQLMEKKGISHEPFPGLVLSFAVWEQLNRPANYVPFSKDRYWLPIQRADISV